MNRENKLGTMPMPRLLAGMALPLVISLLVQSLYNIVDSVFVSRISEDALTATPLAFPVQLLMIAVSVGTAVGVNALLSRSIGAGEKINEAAVTGLFLAAVSAAAFCLLGLIGSGAIAARLARGKSREIQGMCEVYLRICTVFCAGNFLATMYQRFLQAAGNTLGSMIALIIGAVTNLLLDPLLIFGWGPIPAMGVKGAAIATVIGQWLDAVTAVWINRRWNRAVRIRFRGFHLQGRLVLQIYRVGLPTILTQSMNSIMVAAVNAILLPVSATAVAFFGVYYKLQNFLYMPMHGLGQAAIPITGYNLGAGSRERIRALLRLIVPTAIVISLLFTAVVQICPALILRAFRPSAEMLAIGIPALRIISVTFCFASVSMVLGYVVSGLGNGFVHLAGTALRQLVLLLPAMLLLVKTKGIYGAWYAFLFAEALACGYVILAGRYALKKREIL